MFLPLHRIAAILWFLISLAVPIYYGRLKWSEKTEKGELTRTFVVLALALGIQYVLFQAYVIYMLWTGEWLPG